MEVLSQVFRREILLGLAAPGLEKKGSKIHSLYRSFSPLLQSYFSVDPLASLQFLFCCFRFTSTLRTLADGFLIYPRKDWAGKFETAIGFVGYIWFCVLWFLSLLVGIFRVCLGLWSLPTSPRHVHSQCKPCYCLRCSQSIE